MVEEEQSTLTDSIAGSVETHKQNIIYLNGIPQGFQSHEQWLKACTIHLALWCQNQALDLALKHLTLGNVEILEETCADIIDHVEHCSRIDMVRWLHWGTTGESITPKNIRSTRRLFGAFLDCIDTFGCEESLLDTLFQYSEQWLGENIAKLLEEWIHHHPNTTKFHRWLRRRLHHYINAPKPHWISHEPPMESGWISAGVHRDALLTFQDGFLHRDKSGEWHTFQAPVPKPVTASFGLWDSSWMLISDEQVTKLSRINSGSPVEKQPILTVSRKSPTIGCFQGRPYVVGGEENDHTVCELWDRREKRWVAFHMQHDHHLDDIQVRECTGGIEVLGRAEDKLELWRLMLTGDQSGEWQLLNTIDDALHLQAFVLTETGIVGLQIDTTLDVAVIVWSKRQMWERKVTIPADASAQNWSMYAYENNQVVVSRQEKSLTAISILDIGTGLLSAPLLELTSMEFPSFCTLADGTLLCCTKHDCYSIFV